MYSVTVANLNSVGTSRHELLEIDRMYEYVNTSWFLCALTGDEPEDSAIRFKPDYPHINITIENHVIESTMNLFLFLSSLGNWKPYIIQDYESEECDDEGNIIQDDCTKLVYFKDKVIALKAFDRQDLAFTSPPKYLSVYKTIVDLATEVHSGFKDGSWWVVIPAKCWDDKAILGKLSEQEKREFSVKNLNGCIRLQYNGDPK